VGSAALFADYQHCLTSLEGLLNGELQRKKGDLAAVAAVLESQISEVRQAVGAIEYESREDAAAIAERLHVYQRRKLALLHHELSGAMLDIEAIESFVRQVLSLTAAPTDADDSGGGGGGSGSSSGGAPGGGAGPSYTASTVFTSLELLSNPINLRVTNSAYVGFLNQYGVWNYTPSATYFDQTVTVNFASTGYYNFTGSCDNYATIYIDGVGVLDIPGFQATYSNSVYVTAGNHSVRLYGVNTGGPGSLGLTITGGASFGGGFGSAAGPAPL
jgi:hypothetical protein